jgi:hypothetical protein
MERLARGRSKWESKFAFEPAQRLRFLAAGNFNPTGLNQPDSGIKLVDVTGIEPVTPCLQRTGALSNASVHYFGFQSFQQFRESAFRSKLNPMQ